MRYLFFICVCLFHGGFLLAQSADELRKEAIEKAEAKDYLKAVSLFSKIIDQNPKDTMAYFDRGMVREYAGDLIGAVNDFSAAATLDSSGPDNFYLRALVWEKLKNYSAAISDYKKALSIEPGNADAEFHWGMCLLKSKENAEAKIHFNKSIELNADQSEARVERAFIDLHSENALSDLQRAIEKDPQLSRSHFYFALYYVINDKYESAVTQLLAYAEKTNGIPDSLPVDRSMRRELVRQLKITSDKSAHNSKTDFLFAKAWYSLRDFKKCGELCQNITLAETGNSNAFLIKGLCEERTGNKKKAIESYVKASELNSALTEAYIHAAQLKFKNKDVDGSISVLSKAISLNPFDAYLYYLRGTYYRSKPDRTNACNDFLKAKNLGIIYLIPGAIITCN